MLAIRSRLPSIGFREYCEAGGLLAYGVDFPQIWRQSAVLVDRILKGTKPADLPIQQATRFELVVNLKTAKALKMTIPPAVLARGGPCDPIGDVPPRRVDPRGPKGK